MDKINGRTLSPVEQRQRSDMAARLYLKGHSFTEVSEMLGVGRGTVWRAVERVRVAKVKKVASAPVKRGRKLGSHRLLDEGQERKIRQLIIDKRPEQLKMDFALWTRKAVGLLTQEQCGITVDERSVGNYLKRWGFTPQRPVKRAYEQQPAHVQAWLAEHYPAIKARAQQEGAEIHWVDETAVVNTDVRGRGYSPIGQTPVAYNVWGKRVKLSMVSSVTNQGKAQWMIIDGSFDSERVLEFLKALVKDATQKLFVIMDNLRAHHSKPVKAWLAQNSAKIEAFYLPPYSPELNPDERVNANLKQVLGSRVGLRSKSALHDATEGHMQGLKNNPEKVRAFFNDPACKYAA